MVAQARRARARAPPLTREQIVDAALVLLERDGLQGLSMRRLAQELGSGAASLYWHVGDKEELLSLLLDRIVGEARSPSPTRRTGRSTVKEFARATRRLLERAPRRRAALARPRPGRPELAAGARAQPGACSPPPRCRRG